MNHINLWTIYIEIFFVKINLCKLDKFEDNFFIYKWIICVNHINQWIIYLEIFSVDKNSWTICLNYFSGQYQCKS